jgi:hypothetical protein
MVDFLMGLAFVAMILSPVLLLPTRRVLTVRARHLR